MTTLTRKSLGAAVALGAMLALDCWGQAAAPASPPQNDSGFRQVATIPIPANGANPFDISWVDPVGGKYYLGDRTSKSIGIVDTRTNTLVGQIGGFVGQSPKGA